MPTYAYRGDECGHEFEVWQSFSDDPIAECTACGKPVHRVIHATGIVFKGTGWYITDSRPTKETSGGVQDSAKVNGKQGGSGDSSAPESTSKSSPEPAAAASASKES